MRMSTEPTFGVVMTVVERPAQLRWCLQHLRQVYPTIPVEIISDGAGHPEYSTVCEEYSAHFTQGERLKRASQGGGWWHRTIKHAAKTCADFVMKVDPDTKFQRPIRAWPLWDIAGTVSGFRSGYEHVQGGAQLISRKAIRGLIASRIFEAPELCDPSVYAWDNHLRDCAIAKDYLCTDAMLKHAIQRIGLTWGNWPEVESNWKWLPREHEHYAVTHPHKWQTPVHESKDSSTTVH